MYIKKFIGRVLLVFALSLLLTACWDFSHQADSGNEMNFDYPEYFPSLKYNIESNPISVEGFELGKRLFFETKLSSDNSVSCNSCHLQGLAFADAPQHPVSVGVDQRMGTRNAPSLQNLGFIEEFVWDGGINHLDFVPVNAITNPKEMNEDMANVVEKLRQDDTYPELFDRAFGTEEITSALMLKALSQFMLMMISDDSKYDQYLQGKTTLSFDEEAGLDIFESNCASCHEGPLQSNYSFHNNGIDSVFQDEGRFRITSQPSDMGKFRVPSLRNVSLTAPYMHSAKFKTLEEVVDHYSEGIVNSSTLSNELKFEESQGFDFSSTEKEQLIAFLKTLRDDTFIRNPLFFAPEDF